MLLSQLRVLLCFRQHRVRVAPLVTCSKLWHANAHANKLLITAWGLPDYKQGEALSCLCQIEALVKQQIIVAALGHGATECVLPFES